MNEQVEAALQAIESSQVAEPVAEQAKPAPEPAPAPTPVVQPAPATPQPDREAAERAVQARFQAAQAQRASEAQKALEAARAELETKRAEVEAERAAIAKAKDMERMLKEDPVAFFAAHGLDPKDVLSRVEQRDKLNPIVQAKLDPLERQTEQLKAELAQLKAQREADARALSQRQYDDAVYEIQQAAKAPGFELLQDHIENGLDEQYLVQVANEVYAKNPRARTSDVAFAMNQGLRQEAERFVKRHASLLGEFTRSSATPAPTATPKASTAPLKTAITQAVASQTSGLPKEPTQEERMERAVALMLGKTE